MNAFTLLISVLFLFYGLMGPIFIVAMTGSENPENWAREIASIATSLIFCNLFILIGSIYSMAEYEALKKHLEHQTQESTSQTRYIVRTHSSTIAPLTA